MLKVWKYSLHLGERVELAMPKGARVLDVHEQGRELCLWALVDDTRPLEQRVFAIYGTGHPLAEQLVHKHVGTIHVTELALVWHVFEILS